MILTKQSWHQSIANAPTCALSEVPNRSIVYLDTKDDQPLPGHPDHKFRPMLVLNGPTAEDLEICKNLTNTLGEDASLAMYFIPLTTQHHPDSQPLHISHVPVPWHELTPNVVHDKPSFFDPNNVFAIKVDDLYAMEARHPHLQNVPILAQLSKSQQADLDQQGFDNILSMEAQRNPFLRRQNRLKREEWHEKFGSRGGENNLVAFYKLKHPNTTRFQRPALNQPKIPTPKTDDGPDL